MSKGGFDFGYCWFQKLSDVRRAQASLSLDSTLPSLGKYLLATSICRVRMMAINRWIDSRSHSLSLVNSHWPLVTCMYIPEKWLSKRKSSTTTKIKINGFWTQKQQIKMPDRVPSTQYSNTHLFPPVQFFKWSCSNIIHSPSILYLCQLNSFLSSHQESYTSIIQVCIYHYLKNYFYYYIL